MSASSEWDGLLEEGKLASIYFANKVTRDDEGLTSEKMIGFELLSEGRDVFLKMRNMQISQGGS